MDQPDIKAFTVCVTKQVYEASPDRFKGSPGGEGPCSRCKETVVYRGDDAPEGDLICSDCMTKFLCDNPGAMPEFRPSDAAIAEMGEGPARVVAMLAGLATLADLGGRSRAGAAVADAMNKSNAVEATEAIASIALACPDVPKPGSPEHAAFLAGKDAMVTCALAALHAENNGGRLAHADSDTMRTLGQLLIAVDQTIARLYNAEAVAG